jgi:cobalt-zinc-cadmium efflux system outer membrane protein
MAVSHEFPLLRRCEFSEDIDESGYSYRNGGEVGRKVSQRCAVVPGMVMKTKHGCWVVACLVALAGCQAAARRDTVRVPVGVARTDFVREDARPISNSGDTKAAEFEVELVGNQVVPADARSGAMTLTLQQAIALALAQNPDLVAQRGAEEVGAAALRVAQTYPFNPQYQTQTTPYNKTKGGDNLPVNNQHAILQTFELAGQQGFREAAGWASLNQVRWNIEQVELLTIATTERLFLAALFQREQWELARSVLTLNEELLGVLQRRFDAGQATMADVAQARIDVRTARRQMDVAETNYQTALLDLRRQLNLAPESPLDVVGSLSRIKWHPAVRSSPDAEPSDHISGEGNSLTEEWIESLIANRPDVQAARADVDVARANADLARAARVPNLQIGPFYERDNDANSLLGFKGAINIPVVDTGNPLWRQRCAELQQRLRVLEQLTAKARVDARAAVQRYERARQRVEASRGDFGESLPDELRLIEDQFKAGQVDLVRVFVARSSLIQDQRAYLDQLNELALAASAVTAATGLPPSVLLEEH